MAANKDSENAKSISIAEWQEIFGNIDNDKEFDGMGLPRSDELPPLTEPQESSEDESSESQMCVMRTEVDEHGY